jgi:hypothetical protein
MTPAMHIKLHAVVHAKSHQFSLQLPNLFAPILVSRTLLSSSLRCHVKLINLPTSPVRSLVPVLGVLLSRVSSFIHVLFHHGRSDDGEEADPEPV